MTGSLKAFMKEMIDYAGYFPPENLDLDTAINNYARYRTSDLSWMLGRFIVPYSELGELGKIGTDLFVESAPFRFSVLGAGTEKGDEFGRMIDALINSCKTFTSGFEGAVSTEILETKLPLEEAKSGEKTSLEKAIRETVEKFGDESGVPDRLFFETHPNEDGHEILQTTLEVLAEVRNTRRTDGSGVDVGFKLRCGGTEKDAFPSVDQVAFALTAARELSVPVKCTAGLHHPVRSYRESVDTEMHGFVNVFGGAMLSHEHNLDREELRELLLDRAPEHFRFTDNEFQWTDYGVTTERIESLRTSSLESFGSCSFEEPLEDLKELGWL